MKLGGLLLIIIFLCSFAIAEDIELKVNGKDLGESVDVKPGGEVNFELTVKKGILVEKIEIKSDNKIIENLLNSRKEELKPTRGMHDTTFSDRLKLPTTLPSGTHNIVVKVTYQDEMLNEKTIEKEVKVKVEGGSRSIGLLLGVLPERASIEVINSIANTRIPRTSTTIGIHELSKEDLQRLGMTIEDFTRAQELKAHGEMLINEGKIVEGNKLISEANEILPNIKEIKTEEFEIKKDKIIFMNSLPEDVQDEVKKLKFKIQPEIKTTVKNFEVSKNENKIDKSLIILSVYGEDDMSNVAVIQNIPKDVAQNADDILFREEPEILQEDPVVKWTFQNIPKGETKDFSMVAEGKVENYDGEAIASADKLSLLAKIVIFFVEKIKG